MSQAVSNLIAVTVNRAITAAQGQNLSTGLVLGSSGIIDMASGYRVYSTLGAVATDFGTAVPEYQAAQLWFGQPGAGNLLIGQWAKTATPAKLIGGTMPAASSLISAWTGFTAGQFKIAVNGGAVTNVTVNLSGATNLNGVATLINTALTTATLAVQVVFNAAYNRFEWTSTTTGTAASLSLLTAGAATDISALLAGTTTTGAYAVVGFAAQTALSAVSFFDASWGRKWYSLVVTGASDSDNLAIAGYIEGTNAKHVFGITTSDPNCLVSTNTTNIAYLIQQLGYTKTFVQYSTSPNPYGILSIFSLLQTVDYTAQNTIKNAMWKQCPGVVGEDLPQTQYTTLSGFNCNVFTLLDNGSSIFATGVAGSGNWMSDIFATDALAIALQTSDINILMQNNNIPQTDKGMQIFVSGKSAVCEQFVNAGFLAGGVWTLTGFGTLNQGDVLPKGYYVYAPPVALQSAADRGARKSVSFQIAAKLAGGVNTVITIVNENS